jgi:hypothetical protein
MSTCASWILPHVVHRRVHCSRPERDGVMRLTTMLALHLGQRGRPARGGSSGGGCRSDTALNPGGLDFGLKYNGANCRFASTFPRHLLRARYGLARAS